MSTDADVIIYDDIGAPQPWDDTKPLGGSERGTMVLQRAMEAEGLCVGITDGREPWDLKCRALIINRASKIPTWINAKHTVVAAHDAEPAPYGHLWQFPHAFVGKWQKAQFKRLSPNDRVITPILADEVLELRGQITKVNDRYIYAAAPNKGLEATLNSWHSRPRGTPGLLYIADTGYGPRGWPNVEGTVTLARMPPMDLAREIAKSTTFFYVNTYPECFPMTVAMAKVFDCKLAMACQGHAPCGMWEAANATPESLAAETIVPQWLEFLRL